MSKARTTYYRHRQPVWGSKADCEVQVNWIDGNDVVVEFLASHRLPNGTFKVCCIPAFVPNISLGDVIVTDSNSCFSHVIEESGRFVFRIWSEEGWSKKQDILARIASLDGLMETCTERLIAIDAPSENAARLLSDELSILENQGALCYETGRQ